MWFSTLSALWRSGAPPTGSKPRPPRPAPRQPTSPRLAVEVLEDRTVPSALGTVPPPHLAAGLLDHSNPNGVAALVRMNGSTPQHSVPINGSADGEVIFQIDPTLQNPVGVQVYEATGESTLLGRFTDRGISFFTLDGSVTGTFVLTAADGSTVSGSYSGTLALGSATPTFEVETVVESGTGRLAGISGGDTTVGVLDGLTGAFHFDASGVWILP